MMEWRDSFRDGEFFLMTTDHRYLARIREHANGWHVEVRRGTFWVNRCVIPGVLSAKAEAERLALVEML